MATIAENLQTIKDSTNAIKQAIIDKGGSVSGGLPTYADAIRNISGGESGGSGSVAVKKKDVNFYDYDGVLLYSYTKSAFLALPALPDLPTREGLTCQEWNYNLSKAKEYVEEYGVLDIGATYITDDGKTRLYISIAADGRMDVPLYFSQTVSNGVTIDWGDGSPSQTLSGTGNINTTHTYTEIGDYCISLTVNSGTLSFGYNSSSYCIMGSTGDANKVYCNMLQKIEIGANVTTIRSYAFSNCYSLSSIVIPKSIKVIDSYVFSDCYSLSSIVIPIDVTVINNRAFQNCYSLFSVIISGNVVNIFSYVFNGCYSLSSVIIPESVKSIGNYAFNNCKTLSSVIIPNSVKSIGNNTFNNCSGMAFYDFSTHTSVLTLSNTNTFYNIPSDCKIIVPNNLYDSWIVATNWSTYASKIIKKSDWDYGDTSGSGSGSISGGSGD